MGESSSLNAATLTAVLRDDLAGLNLAVQKKSLENVRIFSNRFCADAALFHDSDESGSALFIGACLRVMADDYQIAENQLKADGRSHSLLDELCLTFLAKLSETLPRLKERFPDAVAAFIEFERQIPEYQRTPEESKRADQSLSLDSVPRRKLSEFILREMRAGHGFRSRLPEGVLNEFARFYRVYPFEQKDLCFYMGIRGLMFLQTYYRQLSEYASEHEDSESLEKWKSEASEWDVKFHRWITELDTQPDPEAWISTRRFVADWVIRWRELFNIYLEPYQGSPPEAKAPSAPAEVPSETPPKKRTTKGGR